MIWTLAVRHLFVKRVRALVLLAGFSLGVGVMIVLLSVGEAMLAQSRDVALVGGGEVTVLPQGIDVEAMRTGGATGMFFGIDRARYLTRNVLGGPRGAGAVRTVAPALEFKLLYVQHAGRVLPVRAGGEIPSRANAVGAGLELLEGAWSDSRADSAWVAPTTQQLYDELDRFHVPRLRDSTWGEWHYFNIVAAPDEWWYVTYLVGGDVPIGKWGGQLLVTHRRPDGRYERFTAQEPSSAVRFDTTRADLTLGANHVTQRDGVYRLHGEAIGPAGRARLDLDVRPEPLRYFPPAELRTDEFQSGYVVPGLRADASGTICVRESCRQLRAVSAYHDHNWGVWRGVSWEWGMGRGQRLDLLYGGVVSPQDSIGPGGAPFFLALADSLGLRQVLRFHAVRYEGAMPAGGAGGQSPRRFDLVAARDADTVQVHVDVLSAQSTETGAAGMRRLFLQMRGRFALKGTVGGQSLVDEGSGFFETYVDR